MTTLTDTTVNPVVITNGTTATPFSSIIASDPLNTVETITITPSYTYYYPYYYYYYTSPTNFGTITDPNGGGSFDPTTHTFTENAVVTGTPTPATQILKRLVYTPPSLSNGNSSTTYFNVSVNGTPDPNPVQLETITPPAITGTVANEPVASGSSTIRPFATVNVSDSNFGYNAKLTSKITLTDGGAPTDSDGLLTGNGLSKTGIGTYTISGTSYYNVSSYLDNLVFTPTAVAAGAIRATAFDLNVTDVAAALSTDDKTTSVSVVGPNITPQPPLIAGTSGSQTVQPGNTISPFNGVTISDVNVTPLDIAKITVTGGGTLTGAGLTSSVSAPGVYTVAATSPAGLTTILDNLSFIPPALGSQPSITTNIQLDVADGTQVATDKKTAIQEAAPPPPPPGNTSPPPPPAAFTIADQTTGQQTLTAGDSYTGPITGINRQVVLVTPDRLNITATAPNVFIHSGSGDDALNVSKAGGNNILDGSTGSNFLTGGSGNDTFYLDDRGPAADVFSTVVGFHSGDNASVFGVSLKDFTLTNLDNQGAVGFKGLDFQFTAAGKPTASLVLTGYTVADLTNGRLTVSYGTEPDAPGVPGSTYLNIHGN